MSETLALYLFRSKGCEINCEPFASRWGKVCFEKFKSLSRPEPSLYLRMDSILFSSFLTICTLLNLNTNHFSKHEFIYVLFVLFASQPLISKIMHFLHSINPSRTSLFVTVNPAFPVHLSGTGAASILQFIFAVRQVPTKNTPGTCRKSPPPSACY